MNFISLFKVTKREEMEQRLDTGLIKGHAYGITAVEKVNGCLFIFAVSNFSYIIR